MADFAELALEGVPYITENYEKVWDPAKEKTIQGFRKIKRTVRNENGDWDEHFEAKPISDEDGGPRSRHYTNGTRSSRSGRGDVVEERRAYRTTDNRARSSGRERDYRRRSVRHYSDSEFSLSPPRRSRSKRRQSLGERAKVALGLGAAGGAAAAGVRRRSNSSSRSRPRNRSRPRHRSRSADYDRDRGAIASYRGGYQDDHTPDRYKPSGYQGNGQARGGSGSQAMVKGGNSSVDQGTRRSSSLSSSSSSDVCSSSEDERRAKKTRHKEWITAGLAAVATIHAAHGVYSSMEARDKRVMEVMKGEMSPEEARKRKNKARLQDAAAIGIAALGIKGAYSEWQEVQESRREMEELKKERAERHEKRMRKLEKHGYRPSGRGRDDGSRDDSKRKYRNHSR